mgnify:CR=1 FL=1
MHLYTDHNVVRSPVPTSFAVLLAVALVLSATGVGAASGSDDAHPADVTDAGVHDEGKRGAWERRTSASTGAVVNNTTQHENPDELDTRNDVGDVTRWLERTTGGDLERSTIELSRGEADLAKRLLGESFTDQFERYAYVAGRTGTNEDDRTAERFRETRETQEEFTDTVQEFRETREAYEEARRNGNEDEARQRARELQGLARRANRTGATLQDDFGALTNGTATDLTEASDTVRAITENVTQQRDEIVRETFVPTDFTLRPESRQISFLDPLRLTGRLAGEDGSSLADRTVRLRIAERTIRTTTDADGEFTTTYRPTLLRAGDQPVTVEFLPRNESIYLGSNRSVTVSVVQVTPDLSVEGIPVSVAFDDRVRVTGRVSAGDVGAGAVPVTVSLGGVRLGTARTDPDGTYSFDGRVPASVDDGDRELAVSVPLEGRALAGVDRSSPLRVDPTETSLTVSGERTSEGTIRVSGRLETPGSNGVPNQQVDLTVDGRSVATARTGPEGAFAERVSVPDDTVSEGRNVSVRIVARYERPNSNLLASRARTTLLHQPPTGGGNGVAVVDRVFDPPGDVPVPLVVADAVGGLFVLALAVVYVRRRRTTRETTAIASDDGPASATDLRETEPPDPSTGDPSPMVAGATAALDDGDRDTAVKLAFTGLKRTTTERLGLPDGTHWEFFVACREAGLDDDRLDTLRRLTELYEQAAFAPRTVPEADARWVVDAASAFD